MSEESTTYIRMMSSLCSKSATLVAIMTNFLSSYPKMSPLLYCNLGASFNFDEVFGTWNENKGTLLFLSLQL